MFWWWNFQYIWIAVFSRWLFSDTSIIDKNPLQRARPLAPLSGWECELKGSYYGVFETTFSLDVAHFYRGTYYIDLLSLTYRIRPNYRTVRLDFS